MVFYGFIWLKYGFNNMVWLVVWNIFSFSTYWEESSNWLICFDAWPPHAAKSLKQGYLNRQRKTRLLSGRVFLSKIYQKSGYPAVRFIVICCSDFKFKLCLFFFGMAKLKCLIVIQDPWLISRCWLKSTRFIRKSRSSCAKNQPQLPGERSHRRARGGRSFPQRGKQLVARSRDRVTGRWRYKVRRCQQ